MNKVKSKTPSILRDTSWQRGITFSWVGGKDMLLSRFEHKTTHKGSASIIALNPITASSESV
jgi:hypothetical protein